MKYEIKIKRFDKTENKKYTQSFAFDGTGEETIAAVLDKLNTNDDLFDISGNPAKKIIWSCSCNQGICGACSMVINGKPLLACKTKLKELKGKIIKLEPLTKFPLVADLKTDRGALYEAPILHKIWNEGKANKTAKNYALEYEASKCMKCGICVEVCSNTNIKNIENGAFFAIDCFLKCVQGSEKGERKNLKKEYNKTFANYCSKSMACAKSCPANIDIRKLINIMNK